MNISSFPAFQDGYSTRGGQKLETCTLAATGYKVKGRPDIFICNPENIRNCKDLEKSLGLKVTRLFIAVKANSDWVIPSTRGNRSAVM